MILRTRDRNVRKRWHSKVGTLITQKPEMIQHILAYVTTLLLIWMSAMTVLIWLYGIKYPLTWYKGRANDISLTSTQRTRKKAVFSPSPLSLDYKNVAHLILKAELLCLPACISHKHPILNLLHAYHFVSPWITFVLRHKEPDPQ